MAFRGATRIPAPADKVASQGHGDGYQAEDFFSDLFSDQVLLAVSTLTYLSSLLIGGSLLMGMIWYERYGNHHRRALLNMLSIATTWCVLCYLVVVHSVEMARFVFGPFPKWFCLLYLLVRKFCLVHTCLNMDAIVAFKYLFTFRYSNFVHINDDLIAVACHLSNCLTAIWISAVNLTLQSEEQISVCLCTGKLPTGLNGNDNIYSKPKILNLDMHLVLPSIVLHLVVTVKLALYKLKNLPRSPEVRLNTIEATVSRDWSLRRNIGGNPSSVEDTRRRSNFPAILKILREFATAITALVVLFYFLFVDYMANSTPFSQLNTFPRRWHCYNKQFFSTFVVVVAIPVASYMSNNQMREFNMEAFKTSAKNAIMKVSSLFTRPAITPRASRD